jgi:hypothetical protein
MLDGRRGGRNRYGSRNAVEPVAYVTRATAHQYERIIEDLSKENPTIQTLTIGEDTVGCTTEPMLLKMIGVLSNSNISNLCIFIRPFMHCIKEFCQAVISNKNLKLLSIGLHEEIHRVFDDKFKYDLFDDLAMQHIYEMMSSSHIVTINFMSEFTEDQVTGIMTSMKHNKAIYHVRFLYTPLFSKKSLLKWIKALGTESSLKEILLIRGSTEFATKYTERISNRLMSYQSVEANALVYLFHLYEIDRMNIPLDVIRLLSSYIMW